MEKTKEWYQSKTVWASLVTVVLGLLAAVGVVDLQGESEQITEKIFELVVAIAGAVALYGRLSAKSKLLIITLFLMLFAGCSQVQMSPAYRQQLEMTTVVVKSLNEDCQAGDDKACREGLAESAEILELLVDAVHGVDSTGGEDQ